MAICPICTDENSANLERVNFHQIGQPEGSKVKPEHQDHWACKTCADIWLTLNQKCATCHDPIPSLKEFSASDIVKILSTPQNPVLEAFLKMNDEMKNR